MTWWKGKQQLTRIQDWILGSLSSDLAELFHITKLIIWDEAPMCHRYSIEALDKSLQDIMHNGNPFGGKVIVFGGDFRQILPVVPRGNRSDISMQL